MTDSDLELAARVCHEAIRAYKQGIGEDLLPCWEDAPDWQRASTLEAVRFRVAYPGALPGAQHEQWVEERRRAGWVYGPAKDETVKTHPMLVAFEKLPEAERRKDALVQAVVDAVIGPFDIS